MALDADGRGWPWKLLLLNVCGICSGNCRGLPRNSVVIAALPRQWPRVVMKIDTAVSADFRGFPWFVRRSLPRKEPRLRAVATTVNRGISRGSAMTRGTCREIPRISTVVRANTHGSPRKPRGQCRGPPLKSQIMCILDFMLHTTTAWLRNIVSTITRRRGCACLVMRAAPRRV